MKRNITLLDGAIGTSLWKKAEKLGIEKKPVWTYNITQPEIVRELAREYLEAGSQIIMANTFGANGPAVRRSSKLDVTEVVRAGVRLTREAVGDRAKVSLDVGPLTAMLEPYGDMEEDECQEIYEEMIGAGMQENPDCITLMTFMDLEMMRIATTVARQYDVPVYCLMTFEKHGKTLMGNSVQQIVETLAPLGISGIGMNCSLGPDMALPIIREFAEYTDLPLLFKPNAGKPIMGAGGEVVAPYDASAFAADIAPALEFVDFIGGCCGCDVDFIRAIKAML
ncbi:MAG: homocysteine S-methyltransferase family protein [Clostridiales bacterium]|nr:homocysteine S-methyltransferase family protein [Clostridiales bacterium]